MMTNLFSIFDPSSPPFFSTNWLSMTIPAIIIPQTLWIKNNKNMSLITKILTTLHHETTILMKPQSHPGTSLFLITILWFILFNNLLGLLPFVFTATSHLIISISMALPMWITMMLLGWIKNSTHMLSHLVPLGTPTYLAPFMICVETISNLIRPITLSVRLSANMIAGHLILTLLSSCFSLSPLMNMSLLAPEMAIITLESAVAIIQAYVFMILLTLYSTEIH
uniref:ATP synthase F0 subunit 6 n=1 Tax=Charinus carajas TaxID=3045142 RepID=UPI00257A5223|nr:ATP synthase F0 subunit 6 [Charinus carajas]WGV34165.1 ATP synthase subunit 6 [Charinus carajas]WGV34178.1 ATP synthase subunit 6 [Charinus carajas]WGV34191.1 ATP synthase subunit 6 [Charinus carajas]